MSYFSTIIYMVVVVVAMVGIMVFVVYSRIANQKKLGKVLPDAVLPLYGKPGTGTYGDTTYRFSYFQGSKNSPPHLKLSIAFRTDAHFCVVKQTKIDEAFKKLGINKEIETGDPAFDGNYYILTQSPEFAARALGDPDTRQTVHALFRAGFTEVKLDGQNIEAKWDGFHPSHINDVGIVNGVLDSLIALSKRIPPDSQNPATLGLPSWQLKRITAFALAGTLAIGGLVLWSWSIAAYEFLDEMNFYIGASVHAAAFFPVFLLFAMWLLRGRSRSGRELVTVAVITLFGAPLSVFGAEALMNGYFDRSEEERRVVLVLDKYAKTRKRTTTYYVRTSTWREDHPYETLRVSRESYKKLRPDQDSMELKLKPGALGHPVIVSAELVQGE